MTKIARYNSILYGAFLSILLGLPGCVIPPETKVAHVISLGTNQLTSASGPFVHVDGIGSSCVGQYYGYARFTNTAVTPTSIWWTPNAGATSGTISDNSGISDPNFVPVVEAVRKRDFKKWCNVSAVTFPVGNGDQFQFSTYVRNVPPPPSDGSTLILRILWQ